MIRGDRVVESEDDQLREPDLPWSGRFHDPAAAATLEEGHAWLRLDGEPVREGAARASASSRDSSPGIHISERGSPVRVRKSASLYEWVSALFVLGGRRGRQETASPVADGGELLG